MYSTFRRYSLLFLFLLFLPLSLVCQESRIIPPEKPKLVIGIVIDQMRYDYIFRYWSKFGDNGFHRLLNEGTFCKNAQFNYLFTQSSVGYATIATGAMPSSHGIISEEWYQRLKKEKIQCIADDAVKAVGGSYEQGAYSPRNLLASTIADEIKLNSALRSKVFGVSMKAEAAILLSGHTADAAYWYDPKTGTWMTSTYYLDSLPAWVNDFNLKNLQDIYLDKEWNTLLPLEEYTESLPDESGYETGLGNRKTFPYDLASISKVKKKERDYSILASTPFGNTFTKDFAIQLIVNEALGKDEYTDYLALNFSSTEKIGLNFGPGSVEIEDTYLRLDQELGHFLEFIDKEIGKKNVLIFLTSNHGVSLNPGYLENLGIPGGFFNLKGSMSLLASYLNAVYGNGEWIDGYTDQQIFLNRELIEDSRLSLEEFQNRVARFMVQFTGVANAITSSTLETTNFTEGIFFKIQNGFNQKRSGDIIINFEPGWVIKNGNATGNNSSYRYDSHVPLIWYGWRIRRVTILTPVDMTSVAPTIAFMLNISFPSGASGQPIQDIVE
jgi:hypothetical protein